MRNKAKNKPTREQELAEALRQITLVGSGIRETTLDYKNCFLKMKEIARKTLAEKCKTCGQEVGGSK